MKFKINEWLFPHLKVIDARKYPNYEWYLLSSGQGAFFTLLRIEQAAHLNKRVSDFQKFVRENHYPSCFLQIFSADFFEEEQTLQLLCQECYPLLDFDLSMEQGVNLSRSLLDGMKIFRRQGLLNENLIWENLFLNADETFAFVNLFEAGTEQGFYHMDQDLHDLAALLEAHCQEKENIEYQRFLLKAYNYGYPSLNEVEEAFDKIEQYQKKSNFKMRKSEALKAGVLSAVLLGLTCFALLIVQLFFIHPQSSLSMEDTSASVGELIQEEVFMLNEQALENWELVLQNEASAVYKKTIDGRSFTLMCLGEENRMSFEILKEEWSDSLLKTCLSEFPYFLRLDSSSTDQWPELFSEVYDYLMDNGITEHKENFISTVYSGTNFYASSYADTENEDAYFIVSNYEQSILLEAVSMEGTSSYQVTFHYYTVG